MVTHSQQKPQNIQTINAVKCLPNHNNLKTNEGMTVLIFSSANRKPQYPNFFSSISQQIQNRWRSLFCDFSSRISSLFFASAKWKPKLPHRWSIFVESKWEGVMLIDRDLIRVKKWSLVKVLGMIWSDRVKRHCFCEMGMS